MFVEHRCDRFRHGRRPRSPATAWSPAGARSTAAPVFVFAKDFTVFGGSLSEAHAEKIIKVQDMALQQPRADHRPLRCRRRAHPGGRGGARRLCRGLPAQRARLRRHPADLRDHGPLRRRRRLFAGDDRLHLHGARHLLHVRHRAGRGEDGDQRDRDGGGARRRLACTRPDPRSPTAPTTTTSRRCCRCAG